METALYNSPTGPLVTPEEFLSRATRAYKEKGIKAYCRLCKEEVFVFGTHTVSILSGFKHSKRQEGTDLRDACPLAHRDDVARDLLPDQVDHKRGVQLRRDFFEDANLRLAYGFCLNMCQQSNLPIKKFKELIERGDKKNIWAYANLPLWFVPYILLTFGDFTAAKKDGKGEYEFHFVFDKPHAVETISSFLAVIESCRLKKLFKPSGKLIDTPGNPFVISEEFLLAKSGKTDWIKSSNISYLKQTLTK